MTEIAPDPLSVPQWRNCALNDPAGAAEALLASIRELPRDLRDAVVAWQATGGDLGEAMRGAGAKSPLAGVPCALKDLFALRGVPTRAGSLFLDQEQETPGEDSAMVTALREAGAAIAVKTHLNEFAYGLSGENAHYGDVPHPRFPGSGALAGGSSSGSAWMVASGLVPFAIGTDTGGSIRTPAAFCGLYGLRLTPEHPYSREGSFPLAPSFDTAGWFTRTPGDMRVVSAALLPEHALEDTSTEALRGCYAPSLAGPMDPAVAEALEAAAVSLLGAGGPERSDVVDTLSDLHGTFSVLQSTEALAVHERWLDRRKEQYEPAVWARIDRGRHWKRDEQADATARRQRLKDWFADYFSKNDILVLPATPFPSPPKSKLSESVRARLLSLNAAASLGALPAITLPVVLEDGWSVGVQVIFGSLESMPLGRVLARWQAARRR